MNKLSLMSVVTAAVILAACGGGGGGDSSSSSGTVGGNPPPTTTEPTPVADTPPDSASQSAEGFTAYLEALAAAPSDTADAVDLSKFLPPKSETAEPSPVH